MSTYRRPLTGHLPLLVLALLVGKSAQAVDLGPDCEPAGVSAMVREAWDPKVFWTRQLKEIHDYVEGQKVAHRLNLIDRKRDRVNAALDAEEMKTMGIPQTSDPELDQLLAKTDREIAALDRELLQKSLEWGQSCTAYATQQLSKSR